MLKNTAGQVVTVEMLSASDSTAFTGTVTVYVKIDGGSQTLGSVGSGICTHDGNGSHSYAPAQAETNGDHVSFTFIGSGAAPAMVQVYTRAAVPDVNVAQVSGDSTAADTLELFAEILDQGTGQLDSGSFAAGAVNAAAIASDTITADKIAADAITAAKIATDAIDADAVKADAVTKIQTGLATSTAQTTAQNDLDILTGTDGATLATAQGNYAPAKAGDEMDLVDAPNATAVTAIQDGLALANKMLGYVQLIARSDAAIGTDRSTELAEINANEGSGGGSYGNAQGLQSIWSDTNIVNNKMGAFNGIATLKVATDAIITDTNELQTDWANGGRLDLILDARASQAGIDDIPTVAEFNARTLAAADYFDPATDTVAHVTLVDTTTTNTDMRGTDGANTTTPPTVGAIADAVWDEALSGHATAGTAGKALSDAGGASITVAPLQVGVPPTIEGTEITVFFGESGYSVGPLAVTDGDGDPVDLSGRTLELTVETLERVDLAVIASASITISGDDNNQFSFVLPAAATTDAVPLKWSLRDVTGGIDRVLAYGRMCVEYAARDDD